MNPEIIKKILKFTNERDWKQFHSPENLAKSISIEAGELLECFQWSSKYNQEETNEELADVVIYSILMAESINADIEEIIIKKLEKNIKKYPVEKSRGNSTKYDKL